MKKIDILKAMNEGRAKYWTAQDAVVIERPGQPCGMFVKGDAEYQAACDLVDADLATQKYAPLTDRYVPLVATDKGKQHLAHADRANPRSRGRHRNRTGTLAR